MRTPACISSRSGRRAIATITAGAAIAVLTACSASSSPTASAVASASSAPEVVDGITVPPVYEPPTATVVPGPATCPSALADALGAARGEFTLRSDRGDHLLTCTYTNAHAAPNDCSKVSVRVNTAPQAFTAFDRWNVETGQNSMWSNDPKLQPVPIAGIGVLAEWVPALRELGTADATTWVSVFLTCPGSPSTVPELARVLAREGLASAG